jgi:protein-S-isoprenylcysteine O-methyltransferase Ste14
VSTDAAHTRWWQTFETVFGLPFIIGAALQLVAPLSFGDGWVRLARVLMGVGLIIVGLAIVVAARRELRDHQQPTDPSQATSKLVTTGVFAYSRNPLYLGGMGVLVGLAIALSLVWALLLLLPAFVAAHRILVQPEERYLAARFGASYRIYAATVNRWIGRNRSN